MGPGFYNIVTRPEVSCMKPSRSIIPILLNSLISFLLLVIFAHIAYAEPSDDKHEYIFAVVPQSTPEIMHRNWTPVIEQVARISGLSLKLKVYENMNDFELDLKRGIVHFAYLNPAQAVMAWNEHNYIPLVRSKNPVTGTLYVRTDSAIKDFKEIKGKEIAFVGPKNICGISLNHELKALNINKRYVGTSSNVYKHVLVGEVVAGGTLDIALESEKPEVTQALRPIYKTRPISSHPISAHPAVPAKARQKMVEAVLKLAADLEGRVLLKKIRFQEPVVADYDRDYKVLESMGINRFE